MENITIEFVCTSCLRKRVICLNIPIGMDDLANRIVDRKCLNCKGDLDISHINFVHSDNDSLIGEK